MVIYSSRVGIIKAAIKLFSLPSIQNHHGGYCAGRIEILPVSGTISVPEKFGVRILLVA